MRRSIILVSLVASAPVWAGGFEIAEQSPQGIATVGAQTAVADDSAAVFYNPAGMAYQPGFGALAGGQLAYVATQVQAGAETTKPNHTGVAPVLFATQRLGRYFAIGIGSFANFAEHFEYPSNWSGRFLGTFVDVTTATINPALAYRPLKQLAFGAGLDIVIGSLDIYQAVNFGGGEGRAHAGLTGVGVGGNVGVMVDAYKQYLRLGFTYRSRVDIHFDGTASIDAPPEVQAAVAGLFNATTTLPLPHSFVWGLSSKPTDHLTLSADLRYTLWQDISTITLDQTSQQRPDMSVQQMVVLDLRNSWGVRVGVEYRMLDNRLRLRLGGGWDQTPVPRATLGPLIPDTNRVLVGTGLGWVSQRFSVEAGYLAAILTESTSEDPNLRATYSNVGHVVSVAFTLRFAGFGGGLAANDPTWSNNAQPPKEMGRITAQNVR